MLYVVCSILLIIPTWLAAGVYIREVAMVRLGAATGGPVCRSDLPALAIPLRFTREFRPMSVVRRVHSTRLFLLRSPCIGGEPL
jgi:hypothetical protein